MGFLTALVSFVAAQAEAHPDILRTLVAGITAAVDQHEQHGGESSMALTELRAGIAAAASSAVTSLVARQTPAAVATEAKPLITPTPNALP